MKEKFNKDMENLRKNHQREILEIKIEGFPRWQLEGGRRKHASYCEILERHWRHTLQAKPPRRHKTLTPPHLQPAQSISNSC
jgi:hypothetical protein